MSTIPENNQLLKHLFELIEAHRPVFKQQRVYARAVALILAEIFVFARHTVTQLLMMPGMTDRTGARGIVCLVSNALIMTKPVRFCLKKRFSMSRRMSCMWSAEIAHRPRAAAARWKVPAGCEICERPRLWSGFMRHSAGLTGAG